MLLLIACLAFVFAIWVLYGSGCEAVFWDFLALVAGIPIYTWRKCRSKVEAEKAGLLLPVSRRREVSHVHSTQPPFPHQRYDKAAKPMIGYFLAFEESCNRFPGFSYEVQGVYQVTEKGRTRFYTYVVKE
ncbi:MAG TPA: hypothetical protein VGF43_22450 [Dongiaceae bacterium]